MLYFQWKKEMSSYNLRTQKRLHWKSWLLCWTCIYNPVNSTKVHLVKAMIFPVVTYGCESWTVKKVWAPKNWCFWTVVLEKTLESPLDCKEIQPVHSKGDQSWVFFGRNDAEAETPVLWPPHSKSWLIGKDAGRDWGHEEKGTIEDEMAGWHHRLDGPEFEWTLGVGDGLGGLAYCDSWGRKELATNEWLNWTELFAAMKLKDTYSLEGKLWPTYTAYSKAETLLCQQRSI